MDSFLTSLHKLAENCVFGVIRNDLIKDRLVGLRDFILSEKLQSDDKLILETALSPNSVIETSQLPNNSKEIAGLKFCVDWYITQCHVYAGLSTEEAIKIGNKHNSQN